VRVSVKRRLVGFPGGISPLTSANTLHERDGKVARAAPLTPAKSSQPRATSSALPRRRDHGFPLWPVAVGARDNAVLVVASDGGEPLLLAPRHLSGSRSRSTTLDLRRCRLEEGSRIMSRVVAAAPLDLYPVGRLVRSAWPLHKFMPESTDN
jgi:hypothetical protein